MLRTIRDSLHRLALGSSRVPASLVKGAAEGPDGPGVMQVVRTYLPPAENWIYEQVSHLERYRSIFASKHIANLRIFPFDPVYSIARSPLPIRLLDRALTKKRGYSPFFADVAASERAQIVHAHGGGIATFVVSAAHHLGLPLVVSFYGTDMWKHPEGVAGLTRKYARVFPYGTLFLAEGPAAGAQLVRIGCPPERILVHRLGVDVAAIPFRPRVLADGGALRVLMASRFVEKKGIPYGVEAFCRVARDHPMIRLTIVGHSGSARDRRAAEQFEKIAVSHRVERQVTICGFMGREQLRELAENHHLLLHPSAQAPSGDAEGGHPVVMTMLAAGGMPILATRHCDIPEVVVDGQTGWLVEEKNPDELEGVIREIIRNPSCLTEMGYSARRLVEARYDVRSNRLDSVYDIVIRRGVPG